MIKSLFQKQKQKVFVKVSWLPNKFSLNCVKRMLKRNTRLCKTAPQWESHSIELFFTWWFVKVLALCLVCGQTQDSQLAESLNKLAHVIFGPPNYFSLKQIAIFFCCLDWFELINLDSTNCFLWCSTCL